MWWMLAGLFVAFLYGLLGKPPEKLQRWLERAVTCIIYGLVFVMGISLGQDTGIFGQLPQLGLISLGFAVATVAGSLVAVSLIRPLLHHQALPAKEETGV